MEEKSDKDPEINIDSMLGTISEKLTLLRMKLCKYNTFQYRFNKPSRFVTSYNNALALNAEFNDKENIEIKFNLNDSMPELNAPNDNNNKSIPSPKKLKLDGKEYS